MSEQNQGPSPEQQIASLKVRCFDLNEHAMGLQRQLEQANSALVAIAKELDCDVKNNKLDVDGILFTVRKLKLEEE